MARWLHSHKKCLYFVIKSIVLVDVRVTVPVMSCNPGSALLTGQAFFIQLFQKRLSNSIVGTGTERNCGVQAAQVIYYY